MAQKQDNDTALWVLAAAGVGVGMYFLFRSKEELKEDGPGRTEAAPLPPLETPSDLPTLGAVATAFDNLKTNWRMGRIQPRAAWDTTTDLIETIADLREAGIGEQAAAEELVTQIGFLRDDIMDYLKLTGAA